MKYPFDNALQGFEKQTRKEKSTYDGPKIETIIIGNEVPYKDLGSP